MKLRKLDASSMHQNGAGKQPGGGIKWRMSVFACDITSDQLIGGLSSAIPKTSSRGLYESNRFWKHFKLVVLDERKDECQVFINQLER